MDWSYRIRLRNLKMLLSVAETGNLSQSAHAMHTTQPALSKWLKDLEQDIGLPLFERHARGLRPTPYGDALVAHARRIESDMMRVTRDMQALKAGLSGRVVLGASGASTSDLVPVAVQRLLGLMPKVQLSLIENTMDVLLPKLKQGDLDIVVGRASTGLSEPAIQLEPLYLEPLQMIARPQHPLFALKRALTWADVSNYRWLVWPQGTPIRAAFDAALANAKQAFPPNAIESNSIMMNLTMIGNSDIVGIASHRVAVRFAQLHATRTLPIHLSAYGSVGMYWRNDSVQAKAVQTALDCLRTVAAEFTRRDRSAPGI